MKREKIKKEVLIEEYLNKNQSIKEVSLVINKSEAATSWWLGKYKINKKHIVIDLTGQRFERLLVLSKTKIEYKNRLRTGYKCICDCGNEVTVDMNSLKRGATKSCGCYNREVRLTGYKELSGHQWSTIRYAANMRNLEFNIDVKFAYELYIKQNKLCAISGVPIILDKRSGEKGSFNTASLDRIDSSVGYIESNIQWLHKTVNIMKNNMSDEVFINWCKTIVDYNL